MNTNVNPNHFHNTDPVSLYNWTKVAHVKKILEEKGWELVSTEKGGNENWKRPNKNKSNGISATWEHKSKLLYVFSNDAATEPFQNQCYYTPFQILTLLKFKGNYTNAIQWINTQYNNSESENYIRVGTDYFKKVDKPDRYGIPCTELRFWRKEEIKQDHGAKFLDNIRKYDSFIINPSNENYQPEQGNNYNLYRPFHHTPRKGDWRWTKILLEQIFGDQLELGYRYLKLLYQHPTRQAPILVLVSKLRGTGKTTFLNWLNMIFSDNFTILTPDVFKSDFNSMYATYNIIAIEETKIEKDNIIQKLKAVSTQKMISVNQKFVSPYNIPFYGKFILTSNDEKKFAQIEQEEIRFFLRKLEKPKISNHGIENNLMNEIPAFLYFLKSLPDINFNVSRNGFTPEEMENEQLLQVKRESKQWIYKEIVEYVTEFFLENPHMKSFEASPIDIKTKWFYNHSRAELGYMKSVLLNDMEIPMQKMKKYDSILVNQIGKKTGVPFLFLREKFIKEEEEEENTQLSEVEEPLPF